MKEKQSSDSDDKIDTDFSVCSGDVCNFQGKNEKMNARSQVFELVSNIQRNLISLGKNEIICYGVIFARMFSLLHIILIY